MGCLRWLYSGVGAVAVSLCVLTWSAKADGINFNSRFVSTTSSSQTTLKSTNEQIDAEFRSFDQRYNLDLTKSLFPYLTFAAGSFYQLNEITTSSQNIETEINEDRISPYLEMNLNNPYYKAGLAYRKTRVEEQSTGQIKTQSDRDQYTATMGMTAMGMLPRWNMVYTHSITSDEPETVNQQEDLFNFTTQYAIFTDLNLDYSYTRTDTDDRLRDFKTTEQTHFGKIAYSHNFFQNRLSLNSGYSINYDTLEFPGTATLERPLLRSAGLSSLDTTPTDGPALAPTPTLIDGDLTASTGLDIGLDGDESTFTNIGLDFGFAVDVNILRIWVDRRPTNQIANSFAWSVYTSPDNLDTSTWTLVTTVAPATLGVFDNRFEITFPTVNTRFIKVVTTPLPSSAPGASSFPNIFITEMEALVSKSGVAISEETTSINHNFNFNLQGRLGRKTTLGYNLYYILRTEDPSDLERDQMTNGFFLTHIFNPIFSASASVQRTNESAVNQKNFNDPTFSADANVQPTNESDVKQKSVNDVSSLALRAAWLKTLNQVLTFSRRTATDEVGDASQNSAILRTNAILYRGWDAFLDVGYTWDEQADSTQSTSRVIKSGTNVTPVDRLTFNLNYTYKETDQQDLPGDKQIETEIDLQGFYVPFPNLSLFAKISIVDKPSISDTFQNYTINWSPFSQGDLQFFFTYNEVLRSENNQTEKTIGPGARWTITRNLTLDLAYILSSTENVLLKTETESFSAEFKIHL
jgi:hypothetical protein